MNTNKLMKLLRFDYGSQIGRACTDKIQCPKITAYILLQNQNTLAAANCNKGVIIIIMGKLISAKQDENYISS